VGVEIPDSRSMS